MVPWLNSGVVNQKSSVSLLYRRFAIHIWVIFLKSVQEEQQVDGIALLYCEYNLLNTACS